MYLCLKNGTRASEMVTKIIILKRLCFFMYLRVYKSVQNKFKERNPKFTIIKVFHISIQLILILNIE